MFSSQQQKGAAFRWALGMFLAAILLCGSTVAAKDLFVDNRDGNDLFTGAQPQAAGDHNGPVRTIAKALSLANISDIIHLRKTDAPYRESITLSGSRCSGMPQQPFTIVGNGAILDGSAPVPAGEWQHFRDGVYRFRPPQMAGQQLFLAGRPAVRVFASRISTEVPELQPRQWCAVGGLLYFRVEQGKVPRDYQLSYACLQTGVTLYHVADVVISDLFVQGFQIDGVALANSARNVALVSLTCRGNGHCGVRVGGASTVSLDDCMLGDNGEMQLLTQPYSQTQITASCLLGNTAPGWVDQGGTVYLGDQRVRGGRAEVSIGDSQPGTMHKP